jgi:nucleoside-diphosphate-sugar epimerase
MSDNDLVLVTGASGFIAKHCIAEALRRGFNVRGTLRHMQRADEVRAAVGEQGDRLSFVEADLMRDEGWSDAVGGCRHVLHVASPYPLRQPKGREDLVPVARDGTLRVLKAAVAAGVERVAVTSSMAAILSGHPSRSGHVFTEADWSNPDAPNITPYAISKTRAERAAWQFMETAGGKTGLVALNPGAVFGPAHDRSVESSGEVISLLLSGRAPLVPRYGVTVVDVRDVAVAHLEALERPGAVDRRFILAADSMRVIEMARVLAKTFPDRRRRLPRGELPDFMVRLIGLFDGTARAAVADLGEAPRFSNEPARLLLGMSFRPAEEAIIAMARSLITLGMA